MSEAQSILAELVKLGPVHIYAEGCNYCGQDEPDHAPDCIWPRAVAASQGPEPGFIW